MDIVSITCSCCGNRESVLYSAENVNKLVKNGWNSFGDALYCPDCVSTWEERNGTKKPLWGAEHTVSKIDAVYERQRPHTVVEWCPECNTEVEMCWDVERDGYKAFCPVCGNRLMLCDECHHRNGEFHDDCDYNGITDSCKFNPAEDEEE